MARADKFETMAAGKNFQRSERLDGAGTELSTTPDPMAGARSAQEIAGRLLCAEEEWQVAHRLCIDADPDFAHELAQIQFAIGAIRVSWRKKHPTALGINATASRGGSDGK